MERDRRGARSPGNAIESRHRRGRRRTRTSWGAEKIIKVVTMTVFTTTRIAATLGEVVELSDLQTKRGRERWRDTIVGSDVVVYVVADDESLRTPALRACRYVDTIAAERAGTTERGFSLRHRIIFAYASEKSLGDRARRAFEDFFGETPSNAESSVRRDSGILLVSHQQAHDGRTTKRVTMRNRDDEDEEEAAERVSEALLELIGDRGCLAQAKSSH